MVEVLREAAFAVLAQPAGIVEATAQAEEGLAQLRLVGADFEINEATLSVRWRGCRV
jgi:hypothetical protein